MIADPNHFPFSSQGRPQENARVLQHLWTILDGRPGLQKSEARAAAQSKRRLNLVMKISPGFRVPIQQLTLPS